MRDSFTEATLVQITCSLSSCQQATPLQRQQQSTILSRRQQQSIKLLQMSALECTREIEQALASNPFLETIETDGEPRSGNIAVQSMQNETLPTPVQNEAPPAWVQNGASYNPAQEVGDFNTTPSSEEFNTSTSQAFANSSWPSTAQTPYFRDETLSRHYGGERDLSQWVRHTEDLRGRLRRILCSYRLTSRDRLLAEYIIDGLNEEGYLDSALTELAGKDVFDPPPEKTEWEVVLKLVQHLDMPGLAARHLGECLHLQLAALVVSTPGRTLALQIVDNGLAQLGKHDFVGLAKRYQSSLNAIQQACALIQRLNPRPGLRYAPLDTRYIIPDVFVQKINGQWCVTPNLAAMPQTRLHRTYADLMHYKYGRGYTLMTQELQEARWLIRNVAQRYHTLQRVAQAIVMRQQLFFEYGAVALQPLFLQEIADELNLHISTVSRAVHAKYMATPRGVLAFKYFFSRALLTQTGQNCSANAVRAFLKNMIDHENTAKPLSDVALTHQLSRQGVRVARRTVSKYRRQLKYPPASMRRR